MGARSAVVLVVDRLGAAYLGPYGNTWVETPEFNRLAGDALVFEQAISDGVLLEDVYRSLWLGTHSMRETDSGLALPLATAAAASGIPATLLTDDPRFTALPQAAEFRERIQLAGVTGSEAATTIEDSRLGQFFAAAVEWLARAKPPFVLWLHTQAMGCPWDAPWEFRARFADEDDPPPPRFVMPPNQQLETEFDPDEVLGVTQAYAGQVLLLDTCVGTFLDALAELPYEGDMLFVLAAPRGLALGEHGRIGGCGDRLFAEVLQVPLMMRSPGRRHASERLQTLVQPADVYATVLQWLELKSPQPPDWGRSLLDLAADDASWRRECACSLGIGQRSIRTPGWFLAESEGQPPVLYAKPDDRWEANEVADLCGDIVEELATALLQFQQLAKSGRFAEFSPLSERLLRGPD